MNPVLPVMEESVSDKTMARGGLSARDKLERLNYYRAEDRHEWSLLSNRLSSYITSQSFLVTSYAIAMGNSNPRWSEWFTLLFPSLIALLGLATSWRKQSLPRASILSA